MLELLDVLFNPDGFFKDEVELQKPIWRGIIVVTIAAILSFINSYISAPVIAKATYKMLISKGASAPIAKIAAASIETTGVIISAVIVFIAWVLIAAILYGISALFNGKGCFTDTLRVTAYSFIPSIVVYPFRYYIMISKIRLIEAEGLVAVTHSGIAIAGLIINLAVLAWQFLLWRYGIKYARRLSDRDSIIVAAIPAVAFALIMIVPVIKSMA